MIRSLVLFAALFTSLAAASQPVITTLPGSDVVVGDTVVVPIEVVNMNNVASISLSFEFDTAVLDYLYFENKNAIFGNSFFFVVNTYDVVRLAWFNVFPVFLASGKLCDLVYLARKPGVSHMTFDTITQGNCEYTGTSGIPYAADYVNGTVTVSPPALGFRGKVFLQGAYENNGMMSTARSAAAGFPLAQPFTTAPWNYSGTEQIDSVVPGLVDWLLLEVRDSSDASTVLERRAVLLMSDGRIVDTNFVDEVKLQSEGNHYIAIRHINHMPLMTAFPVSLPDTLINDFNDTLNFPAWSTSQVSLIGLGDGNVGMITGDINQDGILKFSGPSNDRSLILQKIIAETGSSSITSTIFGYYREDLNMNGAVKFSGPLNDSNRILQNLVTLTGSTSITSLYVTPVPAAILP